jgi:uncharacterized membrane protein
LTDFIVYFIDGGGFNMLRSKVSRYLYYLSLLVLLAGVLGSQAVFAEEATPTTASATQPTITSFTPANAESGTAVVITGTNFSGATAVGFGTTAAEKYNVDSATQITATVAKGSTGDVSVTTPGGTATKSGFHFLKLEMERKFPVLSGEATDTFSADVDISYQGPDKKRFNLNVNLPKDWMGYVQSSYPETRIAAVEMGPADAFSTSEKVAVKFWPMYSDSTNPGEYVTTLEVSSGELKKSIDLTAKITARYSLSIATETGRYDTKATAGSDSRFTIKIINDGTATLENIAFSSSKPEGWTIKFDPEKVDSINAGLTKDVDVVIHAPKGKTVAGDYMISVNASAKKGKDDADIRVTVLTPSIMGWLGIIIVLVVIAGLAVIFWRLGRR